MDRRSLGTSWSSTCFQTRSALGFLFFMVRVQIRELGCGALGAKSLLSCYASHCKLRWCSLGWQRKSLHRVRRVHRVHRAQTGAETGSEYFRAAPLGRQGKEKGLKRAEYGKLTACQAGAQHAAPLQGREQAGAGRPQKGKGQVARSRNLPYKHSITLGIYCKRYFCLCDTVPRRRDHTIRSE